MGGSLVLSMGCGIWIPENNHNSGGSHWPMESLGKSCIVLVSWKVFGLSMRTRTLMSCCWKGPSEWDLYMYHGIMDYQPVIGFGDKASLLHHIATKEIRFQSTLSNQWRDFKVQTDSWNDPSTCKQAANSLDSGQTLATSAWHIKIYQVQCKYVEIVSTHSMA